MSATFLDVLSALSPPYIGPLFVHVIGAIFCLLLSAAFHLFNALSAKAQAVFTRLDYAGIFLLILASAIPPIVYGFACYPATMQLYLVLVSFVCLLAFVVILLPKSELPEWRKVRGIVFVGAGTAVGAITFLSALYRYLD